MIDRLKTFQDCKESGACEFEERERENEMNFINIFILTQSILQGRSEFVF
jgi:hypothetical protein